MYYNTYMEMLIKIESADDGIVYSGVGINTETQNYKFTKVFLIIHQYLITLLDVVSKWILKSITKYKNVTTFVQKTIEDAKKELYYSLLHIFREKNLVNDQNICEKLLIFK